MKCTCAVSQYFLAIHNQILHVLTRLSFHIAKLPTQNNSYLLAVLSYAESWSHISTRRFQLQTKQLPCSDSYLGNYLWYLLCWESLLYSSSYHIVCEGTIFHIYLMCLYCRSTNVITS